MNSRNIIISLVVFVVTVCLCPLGIVLMFSIIRNMENRSISDLVGLLFLTVLCIGPLILLLFVSAWQIRHMFRSRVAGRRLAEEMGLVPLNQVNSLMEIWYGGEYQNHRFAIKPSGSSYRYYANERSRTGVRYLLRIVMEVKVPERMEIIAYRGSKGASRNPQDFAEAFDYENGERLSGEAQTAMFNFVQKGYRTGISGVTLRFSKGTRNLHLRNRATASEGLLAPEVLPDAIVVLVHDHPDTSISYDMLQALLYDMDLVVREIEKSA